MGKTVTVTLTYSGATMGASTINLSYDSSALTLSGQGGNISMANGNTFLLEAMGTSSMSATFTFTAKKAGNYTVTATTTAGETWDQGSFSCGPVSATIKVSEPQSSSGEVLRPVLAHPVPVHRRVQALPAPVPIQIQARLTGEVILLMKN